MRCDKWSDSLCILKIEPLKFTNGSNVKRRKVKDDSYNFLPDQIGDENANS